MPYFSFAALEGLLRVGDAVKAVGLAEYLHARLFAVRYHAEPDTAFLHFPKPGFHPLRRHVGRIRNDGIVKIQKQKLDPARHKGLRRHIGQRWEDQVGKQRKGHKHPRSII